ncbi:DUF3987 domain-containing protein [Singulisphaera sp. PoT]|uniref:DUF3987 domain-containing protein n=1 Tax=Singulisphaera sp. PoT TaxID=3411797 RepID=UPI003BF5EB36
MRKAKAKAVRFEPIELAMKEGVDRADFETYSAILRDPEARGADRAKATIWASENGLLELGASTGSPADVVTIAAYAPGLPPMGKPSGRARGKSSVPFPPPALMPHDVGAERELLATMASKPEVIPEVLSILDGSDLGQEWHPELFAAIVDLGRQGDPVEASKLAEHAGRGRSAEDRAEILAAIVSVFASVVDTVKFRMVAEGLRRNSRLRHVQREASALVSDVSRGLSDRELSSRIESRIASLVGLDDDSTWQEPELEGAEPTVPFPLDVLPASLVALIKDGAKTYPCPPDFIAAPALVAVGAAIGRSVLLQVKSSWLQPANLWVAVVADSGTAKSHALEAALDPITVINKELYIEHLEEKMKAEMEKANADTLKRLGKSSVKAGDKKTAAGKPIKMGEAPPARRISVRNVTFESLGPILQDNPRGLINVQDELSGLIAGMNQYKGGSGNDRDNWLSLYNGTPFDSDRKGQDRCYAPNPFMAIAGNVVPGKLSLMADQFQGKEVVDGFVDRFLYAFPEPVKFEFHWRGLEDANVKTWRTALKRLWNRGLAIDQHGFERPHVRKLSAAARKPYEKWIVEHMGETERSDFNPRLRPAWSKFCGHLPKLILILHELHWACGKKEADVETIDAATVQRAIKVCEYFKAHFRKVLAAMVGGIEGGADGRAILEWILRKRRPRFTLRELKRDLDRRFDVDPNGLSRGLAWLEARHAIREYEPPRNATGRPAGEAFDVNPRVLLMKPSNEKTYRKGADKTKKRA